MRIRSYISTAAFAGALALTGLLIWRWFALINSYSVNVPSWDQFDYYFLLASRAPTWYGWAPAHPSLWWLFDQQFGPHRLGVGLVVSKYLAKATHWNFRAESFLIGGLVCAAMLAALLLKRRLFGRWAWYDVTIPLFMLTLSQHEIWSATQDSSHGAFPLLFVMLYCLAWTSERFWVRYPLVLILNFLAIFTGFGIFLGGVTAAVLLLHGIRAAAARDRLHLAISGASLAVAAGSLGLFFQGYHFDPANSSFRFPDPQWPEYPKYMAIGFASAVGLIGGGPVPVADNVPVVVARTAGWIILSCAVVALLLQIRRASRPIGRKRIKAVVIGILLLFSLLFSANMVVGRISMGKQAMQASRYVPLMLPGLVGLYFAALSIRRKWCQMLGVALALCLATYSGLKVRPYDLYWMRWHAQGKQLWVSTYLAAGDPAEASRVTWQRMCPFSIYPPGGKTHLPGKINYLRDRHLSFFHDNPAPPAHS